MKPSRCLLIAAAVLATSCAQPPAHPSFPAPVIDPQILPLAEKETPAVLETLKQLTSVDSGTGQAAGLNAVADQIERFALSMGGQVQRVTPANNVAGQIVIATFKGTGNKRVMLMAHQDTVYVAGTAAARPFRIDGNRAIAPGIADDKGGIAVFLHAMKLLKARGFTDYERVTMVFNTDEERGSSGSRDTIRSQAAQHDFVMSGEPSGEEAFVLLATSGAGGIRTEFKSGERPVEEAADMVLRTRDLFKQVPETRMNWTLARIEDPRAGGPGVPVAWSIKGKGSHAGVAPHLGVNAIVEASMLVKRVSEAAGAMPGVKIHWRAMTGGQVSNIIPDKASAVLEVTSTGDARAAAEALARVGSQAQVQGAEVSAEVAGTLPAVPAGANFVYADTRVPTPEAFATLVKIVRERIDARKFASSSIAVTDSLPFPPFNATPEGRALADAAISIYKQMGASIGVYPRTYGATDAAWAGQSGKPVIESVGLPGGNYHSSQEEYILIDRIPRRVALVAEMIRAIARMP
jgi:glutamate carboxypeptidase